MCVGVMCVMCVRVMCEGVMCERVMYVKVMCERVMCMRGGKREHLAAHLTSSFSRSSSIFWRRITFSMMLRSSSVRWERSGIISGPPSAAMVGAALESLG